MKYKQGNLFDNLSGKIIIPHIVNNINAMGAGFVVPLYTRWPIVKEKYHAAKLQLGSVQFLSVENDIIVANMCAQHGISSRSTGDRRFVNKKPIRYLALTHCMKQVGEFAREGGYKIVAPKFGSGLAGGKWELIEELIQEIWEDLDVEIWVL